nr:zinc finger, CCHC-type [Tanacetum cinerariifolium]
MSRRNPFHHGNSKRVTRNKISRKEDSRTSIGQQMQQDRFTLLTKTPQEIFALEKGKFKAPTNDDSGREAESYQILSPSSYNETIRRPGVRKLQVVPSTAHGMLKLPVKGGVITLKNSMLVPLECALVFEPKETLSATKPLLKERVKVAINPKYPEQARGGFLLRLIHAEFVKLLKGIAPTEIIDRQLPFEYTITSRSTDVVVMAQPVQNINHSPFRSMFEREKLSGNNFNDWLQLVLRVEKKMYVIEQPLPVAPAGDSEANVLAEWNAFYDAYNEVTCVMLSSMTPEIHRQFENYSLYEMLQELKSMFEKQAGVKRFDLIQTFHACKQEEGKPVAAYVLQMK